MPPSVVIRTISGIAESRAYRRERRFFDFARDLSTLEHTVWIWTLALERDLLGALGGDSNPRRLIRSGIIA